MSRLGRPCWFESSDGWESLVMERQKGVPLEQINSRLTRRQRVAVLARVGRELGVLHRQGVGHCDLRLDNVLVGRDSIALIDFDRSVVTHRARATLADWIGITPTGLSYYPFWKLCAYVLTPRSETVLRRVARAFLKSEGADADAPDDSLGAAWRRARVSDASAPGQRVAYYSLTIGGRHYSGERPWALRWEAIRGNVDFTGKRVVELGCNMGLLSSFALLEGAESAVGADHDPAIVESARDVAAAFGVDSRFEVVDLMEDPGWETRVGRGDVAVAMSLVHWLRDPSRVFAFLAEHREVIFEGHGPARVETARLRELGFDRVTPILVSERGRTVFVASRT